jgi:hypothetical protein
MKTKKAWCRVCRKLVEVALEEGAAALIVPIVGGAGGGAIGRAIGGTGGAVAGVLLGVVAGKLVHRLAIEGERMVCGQCGASIV